MSPSNEEISRSELFSDGHVSGGKSRSNRYLGHSSLSRPDRDQGVPPASTVRKNSPRFSGPYLPLKHSASSSSKNASRRILSGGLNAGWLNTRCTQSALSALTAASWAFTCFVTGMALAGYLLIYTRSIDLLPNELIIAIEGWLRPCGLELGRARVLGRPWSQKAAARICVRRLAQAAALPTGMGCATKRTPSAAQTRLMVSKRGELLGRSAL